MLQRIHLRAHEFGLVFQRGDLIDVLEAGSHWVLGRKTVTVADTLQESFQHELLPVLVQHPALQNKLEVVKLQDNQRALVWKEGRLADVLQPGLHAFWKGPQQLDVEQHSTDSVRLDHPRLDVLYAFPLREKHLTFMDIEAHEIAMFFVDGKLSFVAEPGRYAFWKGAAKVTYQSVDMRELVVDVAGQEIMTADKVTLRINLVIVFQVTDPERYACVAGNTSQALYREAQLALRVAVGGRTLDTLLADKEAVGDDIHTSLAARAAELGVVIRTTGIRDIILPGEMKSILNQVIEAQKRAEANLIQRREETAAARSQANTARLLADNPALARMKELETLQGILAGTKTTFVLGQTDVLRQLSQLAGPAQTGAKDE